MTRPAPQADCALPMAAPRPRARTLLAATEAQSTLHSHEPEPHPTVRQADRLTKWRGNAVVSHRNGWGRTVLNPEAVVYDSGNYNASPYPASPTLAAVAASTWCALTSQRQPAELD